MIDDNVLAELERWLDIEAKTGKPVFGTTKAYGLVRPHLPALLSEAREAKVLREAIQNEPELPGNMPDEMWAAIQQADRETMTEILRACVRATKVGILRRARTATDSAGALGGEA